MYLIVVRLVPVADTDAELEAPKVKGLVLAEATAAERLEHVRVRAGPGRVELVMVMVAEHEPEALLRARAICKRVIDSALPEWCIAAS